MSAQTSILFIDDGGQSDTPLIFLHSLGGNSAHWSAQLAHARKTHRAIAFDLDGHGKSIRSKSQMLTIELLVQGVKTVVKQLNLEKIILVGHSMGGAIAAAFAGKYPDQVAGLLLVDPPGDSTQMPEEQIQQILGAMNSEAYTGFMEAYWQQMLQNSTVKTNATVMNDLKNTPNNTMIQLTTALFRFNPVPAIDQYPGPKCIVAIPVTESPASLHKLRPRISTHILDGVSHWLHMDKPDVLNDILTDFITAI